MSWYRWRNVHRACLLIGNNFPKETLEGHSFSPDLSALLSNGDLSYFRDLFLPFNMNPRLQLLEWSREGELVMCSGLNGLLHSSSLPWNAQDINQFFFFFNVLYKKIQMNGAGVKVSFSCGFWQIHPHFFWNPPNFVCQAWALKKITVKKSTKMNNFSSRQIDPQIPRSKF